VPVRSKLVAACALGYILSPIQLIPTFIPVIGHLDDLFVLWLGTKLLQRFTPTGVLAECEARNANSALPSNHSGSDVSRCPQMSEGA
jgi:uncharacterized membrane protein YkvA (DUF1232 family)